MAQHEGVHEITYTNSGTIPVSEVAASLLANEQILRDAVQLLQTIYPALAVESVRVNFRTATTASPLKEILAYSLIVVFQEDLKREIPALVERITGVDVPENLDTLVTVLVMVVAIYGVSAAWDRFKAKRPDAERPPSIEGNYNTIIQVSGDIIGAEPKQIEEALEKHFRGKGKLSALARRAVQFIRPAKAEDGAAVKGGGVELSADTIRDAPSIQDVALEEDVEDQTPHTGVKVVIHATDIDHLKQGWAGHIPGIVEKRTRMQLYPTVDAHSLFGKREVTGDVIVVSRKNDRDDYVPYLILLLKVAS